MSESLPVLLNAIKALDDFARYQKDAELTQRITELHQTAVKLQGDHEAVLNENTELRTRVTQLEDALKPNGTLVYVEGVYWLDRGDGKRDGPYCPNCFDADRRFIRLNSAGTGLFTCAFHTTQFRTAEYKMGEVLTAKAGVASKLTGF